MDPANRLVVGVVVVAVGYTVLCFSLPKGNAVDDDDPPACADTVQLFEKPGRTSCHPDVEMLVSGVSDGAHLVHVVRCVCPREEP